MARRLARGGALVLALAVAAAAALVLRGGGDEPEPEPITYERFVAPSGGGSECTRAAPCGSFEAAYAAALPGDDVHVAGGSYTGAQAGLTDVTPKRGARVVFHVAAGERAHVRGETAYKGGLTGVTLDGSKGKGGQGFSFTSKTTSHVDVGYGSGGTSVTDFTLRGARMGGNRPHVAGQAIWLSACRDVLLQDIEIYEIWRGDGIQISQAEGDDACRGVVIDRVLMHDFDGVASEDHQDAVQVRAGADITLRNSVIVDFPLPGSQGWFGNPVGDLGVGGTGCVVERSVFARIGTADGGAAVNVAGCDVVLRGNTISGRLASCSDPSPACRTTQKVYENVLDVSCEDVSAIQDTLVTPSAYGRNRMRTDCGQGRGDRVEPDLDATVAAAVAHRPSG
jgi:hypothetical protein